MSSEATTTTSRYHPLRVSAVIDETHDTKSIVFDVPEALAEQFSYRPGQFLTLRLPIDGRYVPRCYSMSSAPALDNALRVTVKRVNQGRGSNWVCDKIRVGDAIELMPPSGLFSPKNLSQNFLLLAHEAGLGACWMTGPLWVEQAILSYLGYPDWGLVGITPVGWPDQSPPMPPRKHETIEWRD